jgi:hypothetical protein
LKKPRLAAATPWRARSTIPVSWTLTAETSSRSAFWIAAAKSAASDSCSKMAINAELSTTIIRR